MTVLWAGNHLFDFTTSNGVVEHTTATYFDSTRVSNSLHAPDTAGYLQRNLPTNSGTLWLHFNIYTAGTTVSGTSKAVEIKDAADNLLLTVEKTGSVQNTATMTLYGTSNAVSATFTVPGGALTAIDIHLTHPGSGAAASADIYINGVLTQSVNVVSTNAGFGVPRSILIRPACFRYSGGEGLLSELFVSTTSSIGRRLIERKPNTAGAYTDFTGTLSDLGTADVTTGLITDAAAERSSWNPTSWGGATTPLSAVILSMRAHREFGAPSKLAQFLRLGSTDYDGSDVTIGLDTYAQEIWQLNPATSAAWSTSDLASLQGGLKSAT